MPAGSLKGLAPNIACGNNIRAGINIGIVNVAQNIRIFHAELIRALASRHARD